MANIDMICVNCGEEDCPADAAYQVTRNNKHGRMAECKSEAARYWMERALLAEGILRLHGLGPAITEKEST